MATEKEELTNEEKQLITDTATLVVALFVYPHVCNRDEGAVEAFEKANEFVAQAILRGYDPVALISAAAKLSN